MRMRSSKPTSQTDKGNPTSMRFYQWRFMKSEIEQEMVLAGFKLLWTRPVSKAEGVGRWLEWNMKITPASPLYDPLFRLASLLLPSNYLAHMLMSAAYKPEN